MRNVLYGKRLALAFGFVLLGASAAWAQAGSVTGMVSDATTGEPLVGAQVYIQGTTRGTLTNAEGRYLLNNVRVGQITVRVVQLGYESGSQTVVVSSGETVQANFSLSTAAVSLDEIVVTVTGEQRARELANAVGSVNVDDAVQAAPIVNITETLQGRAAGVSVLQSSGTAGTGAVIKIRGNSSISLTNTPLIYVDGARMDNDNSEGPGVGGQDASRLNDINPEDIERIEIVKGPAAATLYGTEAAAGVIQIFTKRGRPGQAQWTFRTEYGANEAQDPDVFPESRWHPGSFFGGSAADTVYTMHLLRQFDPFRNGAIRKFAGNVRGGSEVFNYYLSGEQQTEEGTLPNNEVDRYYARGNFNIRPSDEWDFTVSGGYTSSQLELPDNDNNGFGYIGVALVGFPWNQEISVVDPTDGSTITTCPLANELGRLTGSSPTAWSGFCPTRNPGFFGSRDFEDVATLTNAQDVERFTGSVTASYRPFDWLSGRFTLGYDINDQRTGSLIPVDPERPFGSLSEGWRLISHETNRNLTMDFSASATYNPTAELGAVTSVGVQFYRDVTEIATALGEVFPAGATTVSNAVTTQGFESFFENKTLGIFVQEQLSWRDRFFLTPAIRFDDNSAFGRDFDVASYPKLGASYVLSDEDFWPQDLINQFKLRAAWGKSGKQPGIFAALQTFDATRVVREGADVLGVSPANLGNAELSPEIGSEFEVGFDMGVLNNRLGLELTYYNQTTEDALVLRELPPSLGFPEARWENIGAMTNSGIELTINALAVSTDDVALNLGFNFATNNNEITELEQPITLSFGASQRHQEGYPYASYFTETVSVDESGNVVVSDTAEFHGQPDPKWEGAVTTQLTLFDRVTLYTLVDFKGGHHLFNSTEEFRCGFLGGGEYGGICPTIFETDADGNYTDAALIKQEAADIGSESPWVEPADFVKLRTVSVRFDFPETWLTPLRVSGASLTLSGQNLATWTDYSGVDPEVNNFGQNETSRAEFLTLPLARRYMASLSVRF